jgi:hypothetical protein
LARKPQRLAAHALMRFRPPQRNTIRREPPLPGLPTRVTLRPHAYHAPRRFAPSTVSLVSFQPGALTGFYPSELDLTVIVFVSRRRLPLLRLAMPETRALNTVAGARGLSSKCDLASGDFPLPVGDAAQEFIRSSTPWLSWVFASLGYSPSSTPASAVQC